MSTTENNTSPISDGASKFSEETVETVELTEFGTSQTAESDVKNTHPNIHSDAKSAGQTLCAGGDSGLGSPPARTVESPGEVPDSTVRGTVETVESDGKIVESGGETDESVVGTDTGDSMVDLDPRDPANYAPGTKWHYAENTTARIFSISSNLTHPDTGVVLHTPESLDKAAQRRGVTKCAWVIHDKDVWDVEDVAKNPRAKVGEKKPAHFHAVEHRKSAASIGAVARAWGVPPNFVIVKRGHSAFEACCQYLTHEHKNAQAAGKHLYSDDEVHVYGFDFRADIDALAMAQKKGGKKKLTNAKKLLLRIQEEGLTPRQAKELDPEAYMNAGYSNIHKARDEYLACAPLPAMRTNYYFCGEAGAGKSGFASLYAAAIAKENFPDLDSEDAVFFAGRSQVSLQSYAGQPIIIWDDYRPWTLIKALGGREGVFSAFDIAPNRSETNKKYGSVRLLNSYNIVTGVLPYREFLDGLAGEYVTRSGEKRESEDVNQSYRRFPLIAELTRETVEFYMSEGFMDGTSAWQSYVAIGRQKASMKRVLEKISRCNTEAEKEQVRAEIGTAIGLKMLECDKQLRNRSTDNFDAIVQDVLAEIAPLPLPSPEESELNNLIRSLQPLCEEIKQCDEVINRLECFVERNYSGKGPSMDVSWLSTTDANRYREARVKKSDLAKQIRDVRVQLRKNQLFQEARDRALYGWLAAALSTPVGLAAIANGHTVKLWVRGFPGEIPEVHFTVSANARQQLNVVEDDGSGIAISADNTLFDRVKFTYNGVSATSFEECPDLLVQTGL